MADLSAVKFKSHQAVYTNDEILAAYNYKSTSVTKCSTTGCMFAQTIDNKLKIRTQVKVPNVGLMIVGIGGNNGTTVVAGIIANRLRLQWETKDGLQSANWFGSMLLSSTMRLGYDSTTHDDVYVPVNTLLPMTHPKDWVVGGWDISGVRLGDAMKRAKVIDINLQKQLYDELQLIKPLPSAFFEDFVAANQSDRADNIITGTKREIVEHLRNDIRKFKKDNNVDEVIVMWSANTERCCDVIPGLNITGDELQTSIDNDVSEISPSTIYCVASILERCSYINGAPQNTFVPGVYDLASIHDVFIGGDDFKSGQTKMKSVIVDFLIAAGLKPLSIASYNHLGNNDGMNLSSPVQFRSKELSKRSVIHDMVTSNSTLYPSISETPDHCVVIKYLPAVGDSKRAIDEYYSAIFLGGDNTMVIYNKCEDSLLAAPLIIDLVILTELFCRIHFKPDNEGDEAKPYKKFRCVLSILSYYLKSPAVPPGTPIRNGLFGQRECILNVIRACVGLTSENYMELEHKLKDY